MWKLLEHFDNCNESEKLTILAEQARVVKNRLKLRESASATALADNRPYKGVRGGGRSTSEARLARTCEMYDEARECYKALIKRYLEI